MTPTEISESYDAIPGQHLACASGPQWECLAETLWGFEPGRCLHLDDRHLEYDQLPEEHLFLIAQKESSASADTTGLIGAFP